MLIGIEDDEGRGDEMGCFAASTSFSRGFRPGEVGSVARAAG